MKKVSIIMLFISAAIFSQCVSKHEQEVLQKVSTALGGATVSYQKGVNFSTSEGQEKEYVLNISGFELGENPPKENLNYIQSTAAMTLYDNLTAEELAGYDVIKTDVQDGNTHFTQKYSLKNLKAVQKNIKEFSVFIEKISATPKGDVSGLLDQRVLQDISADSLINLFTRIDSEKGKSGGFRIHSFDLVEVENKPSLHIHAILERPNFPHKVEAYIDPKTNKIIGLSY